MHLTVRQHECKIQFLPWTFFFYFRNLSGFIRNESKNVDIRSEFGTKTGAPEFYQPGNASTVFITVSVYIQQVHFRSVQLFIFYIQMCVTYDEIHHNEQLPCESLAIRKYNSMSLYKKIQHTLAVILLLHIKCVNYISIFF